MLVPQVGHAPLESAGLRSGRAGRGAVALALALLLAGCSGASAPGAPSGAPGPSASAEASPRAAEPTTPSETSHASDVSGVAVGDIACEGGDEPTADACRQQDTADLAASLDPQFVLALGDLQYESGALDQFEQSWKPTWGRFDDILLPVPGNHEYRTDGASGYRSYVHLAPFSARRIGAWEVYLLDSDCDHVDCGAEGSWLSTQLREHPNPCTAVVMHHPRVSSGPHGDDVMVKPLWQAAVEGGVDLALMGHDHDYERFGRLGADGAPVTDPAAPGIREFVVGTGGRSLYALGARRPGSEFSQDRQFGVLGLTLSAGGYAWRYVALDGSVLDSGTDTCRA